MSPNNVGFIDGKGKHRGLPLPWDGGRRCGGYGNESNLRKEINYWDRSMNHAIRKSHVAGNRTLRVIARCGYYVTAAVGASGWNEFFNFIILWVKKVCLSCLHWVTDLHPTGITLPLRRARAVGTGLLIFILQYIDYFKLHL